MSVVVENDRPGYRDVTAIPPADRGVPGGARSGNRPGAPLARLPVALTDTSDLAARCLSALGRVGVDEGRSLPVTAVAASCGRLERPDDGRLVGALVVLHDHLPGLVDALLGGELTDHDRGVAARVLRQVADGLEPR